MKTERRPKTKERIKKMTINIEEEVEIKLDFDHAELINTVAKAAAEHEECPYDFCVNVVLTDNDSIHEINKEYRNVDAATDVLSFPMAEYPAPGDFSHIEDDPDNFDPDTGEMLFGDIMISMDKVYEQAEKYGHSVKRELAFLVAHSMLHLMGFDHMEDEERKIMEEKQESILSMLKIER